MTKLTFDANIQSLEGINQKIEVEKEGKRIREEGKETKKKTRPDTRHKMRLVCVLFTFQNNTGRTYGHTDIRTYGPTDGHDLL